MSRTSLQLDLQPEYLGIVREILRNHVPDRKVLAFGSRAAWAAKKYSDLDLAILGDEPLTLDATSALSEEFEESDLPFKVDLVDWTLIDKAFRNIIHSNFVTVQDPVSKFGKSALVTLDWPLVAVQEFSEKVAMGPFGSSIKVETFVSDGVPVISGQHLHGSRLNDTPGYNFIEEDHAQRLANANVQRGDIVLTHRGNIGQVSHIPGNSQYERYVISQSQFCMRCDPEKAIPEFVTYYFRSPEGQYKLLANASQVGVPSIAQPVTYLRTIEVPLPPLPEQRSIAHILGTLDDKIELNRRMNETLESMARAIFKDWFVDFGPTRAKVEGREPYLSSEFWDLFPDKLDDEDKPVKWLTQQANHLFEFNPRETIKKGTHSPYLDMAALPTNGLVPEPPLIREYKSGTKFRDGDTLLARITPCLENGKTAYVFGLGDAVIGAGSTEFIVIRSRNPLPRPASYLLARTPTFRAHMERSMTGTSGRQRASVESARSYEITTPVDGELWEVLGTLIHPIVARLISNAQEIRTLAQTRNLLLPKLMSGEIRIRDAVKIAESAVS